MKVSVIRPDHLGDHVLFSGAWKHLRQRWPEAEIILYASPFAANLLEHCPYLTSVIPIDRLRSDAFCWEPLPWLPQLPERNPFSRAVRVMRRQFSRRKYKTDVLLLPLRTTLAEYHYLLRYTPARLKIGIEDHFESASSSNSRAAAGVYTSRMTTRGLPKDFPELELNLKFLTFLGCKATPLTVLPEFWTTTADREFAQDLLSGNGDTIFGLAPGVPSNKKKELPPSWYAEAFRALDTAKSRLFLFGTGAEFEYLDAVKNELERLGKFTKITNLAGRTTPRQVVECVRICDLILSQETGFLHIAVALNKPAVGIVGGGHFNRFFPWGDPARVHPIFKPMDCFHCDWNCKYDTLRCIQEISPGQASFALETAWADIARGRLTPKCQ